jgi:hypothetical protein
MAAANRSYRKLKPWHLLFPVAVGIVWLGINWLLDAPVAKRELKTRATITEHEPENHNRYLASYVVNGVPYESWVGRCGSISELYVGQPVEIYYDPKYPIHSGLCSFRDTSRETFGSLKFFSWIALGLAFLISAYELINRRKLKQSQSSG